MAAQDPTNPCLSVDLGDFNVVDEAVVGPQGEKGDPGVAALAKATKETTADIIRHLNITLRNYMDQRTLSNPAYFRAGESSEQVLNLWPVLLGEVHDRVQEMLVFYGLLRPEKAENILPGRIPDDLFEAEDEGWVWALIPGPNGGGGAAGGGAAGAAGPPAGEPLHNFYIPGQGIVGITVDRAGRVSGVQHGGSPDTAAYFCLTADAGAHTNQYYNVVEQVWNGAAWVAKAGGLAVAAENTAERTAGTHLLPDGELVIVERSKTQAGAWVYGFCRRVIAWNQLGPPNYAEITNGAPGPLDLATYDGAGALSGERRILARFPGAPVKGANIIGIRLGNPQIFTGSIAWAIGVNPCGAAALEVHAYLITSDFDPATVTWATQPGVQEIALVPAQAFTTATLFALATDASAPSLTGGSIDFGWHAGAPAMNDYVEGTGLLTAGTDYYGIELRGNITNMLIGPYSGALLASLPAFPFVMYRS